MVFIRLLYLAVYQNVSARCVHFGRREFDVFHFGNVQEIHSLGFLYICTFHKMKKKKKKTDNTDNKQKDIKCFAFVDSKIQNIGVRYQSRLFAKFTSLLF